MLTHEQNELLCRVEGAAPMGGIMRRHWLPVCMSEEVAEKDGAPVKSRLVGEDLVVFRDSNGKLGVLDEHCPHRGASLVFGRNEEGGRRRRMSMDRPPPARPGCGRRTTRRRSCSSSRLPTGSATRRCASLFATLKRISM